MQPYTSGKRTPPTATIGFALCLLAGTSMAQSSVADGSGIRFSGFGTVGIVHAEAPAGWGFLRSLEQPASTRTTRGDVDSRLGVQLNYAVNAQVELVGQLLATRRLPSASAGDTVEWAFAAYRPTADLTLRAGRLNLDQFLMSDYRNVGFAYLYARPPVEYYGTIPTSLDGVDATRTWRFDDVQWRVKGYVGRSRTVGVPLNDAFGVAIARESDGLLLRVGWSRAKLTRNYDSLAPLLDGLAQVGALPIPAVAAQATALRSGLDLTTKPLTYAALGASYERGAWQTAAEVTRVTFGNTTLKAGYASIGRRVGAVTLFGIVSGADSGTPAVAAPAWAAVLDPVIGPAAAQQVQALGAAAAYVANQSMRQTTYALGARWDVHPRMAVKLQWDHVKIATNGGFYLWSNATSDPASANVTTVLLDFVF